MLTLATYNIHRCIGSDGRYDPARVREVLRELDADVFALQEVEVFRDDPGLLDYLCEGRPWRAIHGITMERESGGYGNAVISRLPVCSVHRQDLSFKDREPRGALHVRFGLEHRELLVVATHLGLRPAERRDQARELAATLDAELDAPAQPTLTVLMGDFNEWFLWGRPLRLLRGRFPPAPSRATFPARFPLFAIDRIWVGPGPRHVHVKKIRNPLTRVASDHLPLVAQIEL